MGGQTCTMMPCTASPKLHLSHLHPTNGMFTHAPSSRSTLGSNKTKKAESRIWGRIATVAETKRRIPHLVHNYFCKKCEAKLRKFRPPARPACQPGGGGGGALLAVVHEQYREKKSHYRLRRFGDVHFIAGALQYTTPAATVPAQPAVGTSRQQQSVLECSAARERFRSTPCRACRFNA